MAPLTLSKLPLMWGRMYGAGELVRPRGQDPLVLILALPSSCCVTVGEPLPLSGPSTVRSSFDNLPTTAVTVVGRQTSLQHKEDVSYSALTVLGLIIPTLLPTQPCDLEKLT